MGRFDNKVVIVTGSSSGIGQAVLVAFAQEGARGDIQDKSVQKEIVEKTAEKFGKIDVLVNNAGIGAKFGTKPDSEENFDFVLGICFKAPYLLTQLALPYLEKTKGNVVNTSSIVSFSKPLNVASWTVYGAAKSALDTWTKYEAQRLAKLGVRINNINPGPFLTNQIEKAIPQELPQEEREKMKQKKEDLIAENTVFGRFGDMKELTPAYLLLADNDRSGYTTGSCWTVDGGMSYYAAE